MSKIIEFIKKTPKAELHLHIEGTLEPDLLFRLAKKNNIQIPFSNVDEIKLLLAPPKDKKGNPTEGNPAMYDWPDDLD